eukprot:2709300-Alexandrium_andersonii.AAC.1
MQRCPEIVCTLHLLALVQCSLGDLVGEVAMGAKASLELDSTSMLSAVTLKNLVLSHSFAARSLGLAMVLHALGAQLPTLRHLLGVAHTHVQ